MIRIEKLWWYHHHTLRSTLCDTQNRTSDPRQARGCVRSVSERDCGPNAPGSNRSMRDSRRSVPRLQLIMKHRGPNSFKTCRHAPHGGVREVVGVYTTTAVILDSPSDTALKTAVRSAQLVRPYEEFSTLHPEKILPELVHTAAPTAKRL